MFSRVLKKDRRGRLSHCGTGLLACQGFFVMLLGVALFPPWADGQVAPQPRKLRDLADLSIAELMQVEVTSVSKKQQRLSQVAAAVHVITQEDIRRSGATSIPEALRLAPGVQVARIDASKWAISIRGFNGRWANKLLVLMDGRRVYTPEFGGVYWGVQDTLLDDIERIEVIRGPGATMWGANAVNGVINIITKHARDTQGSLLTAGGGSGESDFGGVRYGGIAGRAFYRGYSKFFQRNHLLRPSGEPGADNWEAIRGGFRVDWDPSRQDAVTFQGDLYQDAAGVTASGPSLVSPFSMVFDDEKKATGGNLLGRWIRVSSDRSQTEVQFYFDREQTPTPFWLETVNTFELQFQQRTRLASRHDLQWGLGARLVADNLQGRHNVVRFAPSSREQPLWSGFLQDEVLLVEDRLSLTLGAKLEHTTFSGLEFQPSVRLLWTPNPRHTVWASISRASRAPTRSERDSRTDIAAFPGAGGLPSLVALVGNSGFRSEGVRAHELGYRVQPVKRFSVDLAAFYSVYGHLRSTEPAAPFFELTPAPAHMVIPMLYGNKLRGNTYGLELAASWNITNRWKVDGSYSWLRVRLNQTEPAGGFPEGHGNDDGSPRHQGHAGSYLDLPWKLSLDVMLYRAGRLPPTTVIASRPEEVLAYNRLDARLGWKPVRGLDLSLGLQNLLDPRHVEYAAPGDVVTGNQVSRSIYGKITWGF